MTPRVCVVSPLYHPSLGGVGRQAMLLTERLRAEGVEIFVIARELDQVPPAVFSPDVPVHRVRSLFPSQHLLENVGLKEIAISLVFSAGVAARLVADRRKFDVAHFHGASIPFFVCLPVLKAMGKKVIAKVAGQQGTEPGALRGRYLGVGDLLRYWVRMADGVVAISEDIKKGLLDDGFPQERIHSISNFVDEKTFYPPASEAERERAKAGFGYAGKTVVISSGRLGPTKGIDVLLEAWVPVSAEFREAQLVLLGGGPLLPRFQAQARELGISKTVDFLGQVGDVAARLRAADVFVLPSTKEGMPNALLEAMACGLPAVATRIGGVVDVIQDEKSGLLFESGDATAVAGLIRHLLADRSKRECLGYSALANIRRSFSIETRASEYVDLYASVGGQ